MWSGCSRWPGFGVVLLPSSGAATRMKAKEPPQSPASESNRTTSRECIDSGGRFGLFASARRDLQRELSASAGVRALVVEQPLLAPQPAAVAGQRAVGAD